MTTENRLITGLFKEDSTIYSEFLLDEFSTTGSVVAKTEQFRPFLKSRRFRICVLLNYSGLYIKEAENLFLKNILNGNDKTKKYILSCLTTGVERFRNSIKSNEVSDLNTGCYPLHPKAEWFPKDVPAMEAEHCNSEFLTSLMVKLFISAQESQIGKRQENRIREDLLKIGKKHDWINKILFEAKGLELESYFVLIEGLAESLEMERKVS